MTEAELQLRAAVALSPLNVEARNKLGKIYSDSGRFVAAGEQFQKSVESQPNWTAYYGLGEIARRNGDNARAEQAYRQAAELNPVESPVHFALGAVYSATGRTAEAVREYQTGLATDPTNNEALAAMKELKAR